jgi:hypothetical protein
MNPGSPIEDPEYEFFKTLTGVPVDEVLGSFVCEKCNRHFTESYLLTRHNNRKIQCNREIKCIDCNKTFRDITDLKRHRDSRKTPCIPDTPITKTTYSCVCSKSYINKKCYDKHILECPECLVPVGQ